MRYLSQLVKTLASFHQQHRWLIRIAVIAAVPFILSRQAVIEPLLNLWLAGLVPGTDIMLSPDFILGALAILAVVTLLTLVLRWLWRRSRQIGEYTAVWAASEQVIYERPSEPARDAERRLRRDYAGRLKIVAVLAIASAGRAIRQGYLITKIALCDMARLARRALVVYLSLLLRLAILTIVTAQYLAAMTRYYAIRSWRWVRPRLYALDIWLERWSLAGTAWVGHRLRRYETVQVGMEIVRQGKLSVKRLFDR